jgi:hypothetical protein
MSGFTRTCSKGFEVNTYSNPCGKYRAKKHFFCPKEKIKVSSIKCIAHRSKGEHMNCEHFIGKKKLIRRKK